MKTRTFLLITAALIVVILIFGAFAGGVAAGSALASGRTFPFLSSSAPGNTSILDGDETTGDSNDPQDLNKLFEPFWQAWDTVHAQYVDQPVDDVQLMRGAIAGMLESLGDPHTSYLDPELMERFNAALNGEEYEGIGAWVDTGGDYLTIITPMPDSPAEKAGLIPGDQIIAIDGEDMTGIDPELARQKVLGPKGSTLTLTILRKGEEEPFDVTLKRGSIVVPTVESKILEDTNLAYIHLYTFGDQTDDDLRDALKELLKENPDGLILDLRNNGGGYLDTAIKIASEFIPDGVVMYEEHSDGSIDTFYAKKGGLATEIPMVVLINEGSASASEIVAGAIQDRDRGVLVGTTSFGKGSVQSVTVLKNNQGQIRVTTARWLTPDKRQINGVGLEPDHVIVITDEDIANDLDPQLEKAIELLTK